MINERYSQNVVAFRATAIDPLTRTRSLNDELRRTGRGGRTVVSADIAALPKDEIGAILLAVANFDYFDAANDPFDEHDFGAVSVGDRRIIWKIDYYDHALARHSPDKTNPAVTSRVMTIMLAEEY